MNIYHDRSPMQKYNYLRNLNCRETSLSTNFFNYNSYNSMENLLTHMYKNVTVRTSLIKYATF